MPTTLRAAATTPADRDERPKLTFARLGDQNALETLYADAMGDDNSVRLLRGLRRDDDELFSLIARLDGALVGGATFSRAEIRGAKDVDVAALSPVAVAPAHRNQGLGGALVRAGLAQARKRGVAAVLAVGANRFFERLGFSHRSVDRVASPWPAGALLGCALDVGLDRLSGDAYYPRAFFGESGEAEER